MTPLRQVLHAYKVDDLTAAQAEVAIVELFDPDKLAYERMVTALEAADGEYNLKRQNETIAEMYKLGKDGT